MPADSVNPSSIKPSQKGKASYRAAKARPEDRGRFANLGQKAKKDTRLALVDKKVKKVSNKIMRIKKSKAPGPAAPGVYNIH